MPLDRGGLDDGTVRCPINHDLSPVVLDRPASCTPHEQADHRRRFYLRPLLFLYVCPSVGPASCRRPAAEVSVANTYVILKLLGGVGREGKRRRGKCRRDIWFRGRWFSLKSDTVYWPSRHVHAHTVLTVLQTFNVSSALQKMTNFEINRQRNVQFLHYPHFT